MNNKNIKYPVLEVNLNSIYNNVQQISCRCHEKNVSIAGIIKGCAGMEEVAKEFIKGGCDFLGSSRIKHLIKLKTNNVSCETMLIRIPMLTEISDLVKHVNISLNSEIDIIKAIEKECIIQNTTHKVVLMFDVGDLREGFIDKDKFIQLALFVENELSHVKLYGIGTNVGCYGSVNPTVSNLTKLCNIASSIENKIGRPLDLVSGGATSSLLLLLNGTMPSKINNLRIGEALLTARDLPNYFNYKTDYMKQDTFTLKAEIIEIKEKPSYPIGELSVDSFGDKPVYEDKGIHKRALLAIGKQDFGSHDKLIPKDPNVEIIGSSSDYLIIDIQKATQNYKVGDSIELATYYQSVLYLSNSSFVTKVFI
ncbi:MAG: alanine/ornithine racemase family PLP-dependent enzyme [Anaeromicrobium sp.]|jgi:predicted amino acid racemase|uniref:alanine/ornithine racemase family PLP-dependent enzyme n=1 Tax=Anaeromicrobium sp. TaxID=1929132 RepID=UPI0025EE352B|nr:alanine/ornithine racemase family PLP-dependent enzyme [Anaeromicrobium sp.]MCT4595711.1 alanine/ornithine racemase family PLP-dependent enzyme [Anaeromicrobium sp.]